MSCLMISDVLVWLIMITPVETFPVLGEDVQDLGQLLFSTLEPAKLVKNKLEMTCPAWSGLT